MAEFDGIPRVKAEISDGNLRLAPVPSSPKVTILGITTNTKNAVNDPVLVRPETKIADFDNTDGTASELSKAIIEARDAGARNIEVVVISQSASLTAAARKTALDDCYKVLVNHPLNHVVVIGARIDTPSQTAGSNFAYQLANFCYKATRNFNSCIGYIDTEPPVPYASASVSLTQLETWVAALETYDTTSVQGSSITVYDGTTDVGGNGIPDNFAFWATDDEVMPAGAPPSTDANVLKDTNNNPIDLGKYISVVSGSYRFANEVAKKIDPVNLYYHNGGAAAYAGKASSLRPHVSTTGQVIPGLQVIRNLSIGQADRLSQRRFIVLQGEPRGLVAVNGMTGAYNISKAYRSDFVRLTAIRITLEAIERVRSVCRPFIGKGYTGVLANAMREEIDQNLFQFQVEGALQRYAFDLISTPSMQVLGQMKVNLTIVPAFEITEITINVALQKE